MRRYGSTALVTGASSGIGASFCRELAEIGCTTIVAVARRADRLEALKAELAERCGAQVVPIAIDLACEGAPSELFSRVESLGFEVDIVVNNAGFGVLGDMETIELARTSGMVDLNCRAVVEVAALFLSGMKRRGRGAMIITSSVVGTVPAPWFAVYSATKAFDLYLGEALHAECKGSGVDVVTVLPGLTRTEFQAGAGLDRQYHSPYRAPEDVVRTALGALGRKAIVVDGGLNKLLVHGTRFLPRAMLLWLSRIVMKVELRRGE
jgi:short-subunit dehydrogenase